jgi:hypothetical protein
VRGKVCGSPQQIAYFFIAGLGEICVPLSYAQEWLRRDGANYPIGYGFHLLAGLARRHRYSNDNLRRLLLLEREHSDAH